MGLTKIEWAHYTFNPWVGCTKVSDACDHCYAEGWAKRTGQSELWNGERRRTSKTYWQQPHKWARKAMLAGFARRRVFCASLADVFDNQVPEEWRADLWELIATTAYLDWLLLTKRPQNIAKMLPAFWPLPNVWLGTTVENQEEADRRIPHLLAVEAQVHFLSCEPLLSKIYLREICHAGWFMDALAGMSRTRVVDGAMEYGEGRTHAHIGWIIAGSESGHGARPCDLDWVRGLRDQCQETGAAFFWKQHIERGRKIPTPELDGRRWTEFPRP